MVQSAWQDALDPQFTQRLLRPWVSPGVIPDALALSILARSQQFKQRLSLLHQFQQRWSRQGQMQVPDSPIVYARWIDCSSDTTAAALTKTEQGGTSSSVTSTQSALPLPGVAPMGQVQQAIPEQQGIQTSHVPESIPPINLNVFQQASSQDSPPLPIVHRLVAKDKDVASPLEMPLVVPLPNTSELSHSDSHVHGTSTPTVVMQSNILQAKWLDSDSTSALTFPLPLPGVVPPVSAPTTEILAPTDQEQPPGGITSSQSKNSSSPSEMPLVVPLPSTSESSNSDPHVHGASTSTTVIQSNILQTDWLESRPTSVLARPFQFTNAVVPDSALITGIPDKTRLDQKNTLHPPVRQTPAHFQGHWEPAPAIPASPAVDVKAAVKIVSSTTVEQTDLPLTDLPLVTPQNVRTSPLQRDNPEHQPASSDVLSSAVKSAKTTTQQQTTPLVFPEQVVPQGGSQSSSGSSHHRPLIFAKAAPAQPPAVAAGSPAAAQPLSQRPSPQSSQVVAEPTVSALPSPPLPSTTPQAAHAPPVNINRLTRQVERKLTRRLTVERERRGQRW